MKIRKKPEKPEQSNIYIDVPGYELDGKPLEEIKNIILDYAVKVYNERSHLSDLYYICDDSPYIVFSSNDYSYSGFNVELIEKEEKFQERVNVYKEKLEEWNEWHEENKDAIEAELKAREDRKREKILARKKKLEEELSKVETSLKKL